MSDAAVNTKKKILLVEDDRDLQELLTAYYTPRGYVVECHDDPTGPMRNFEAAGADADQLYDLILSDLRMPKMDGINFIEKVKKLAPTIPIILITAHQSVEIAIQAIDAGAYDFVVKPIHFPQLNVSIERAMHLRRLEDENRLLRSAVRSRRFGDGIIGRSPGIQRVLDLARRVAVSNANVLITGESGTGKEVIAKAIHQQSPRKQKPFIAINCSAIPDQLLESELFGHAKGAFTGAQEKRLGLFEEAEGGTLFLDEIGDLNLLLQAKLLRVLQERKIKRIGENQFRPINVRIVAATHKNLDTEVREKRFREDLFFRLNVIPIQIPPLRERPEDILPLAEHFLNRFRAESGSTSRIRGFSKAALDHLFRLPWKGNVRELENAIERAVVLSDGPELQVEDLPAMPSDTKVEMKTETVAEPVRKEAPATPVAEGAVSLPQFIDLGESRDGKATFPTLEEFSRTYIGHVLQSVGGVREQAARILDIDRKTLYRKLREVELLDGKAPEGAPKAEASMSGELN